MAEDTDSVNIRELLIRNGWKIEESKENIELRNKVEELQHELAMCEQRFYEDREEMAKNFLIESEQHDMLQQKFSILEKIVKQKDEHQKMSGNVKECQEESGELKNKYNEHLKDDERSKKHDADCWRKKYYEQLRENEMLKKKLEAMQKNVSPKKGEKNSVIEEKSERLLTRSKVTKHLPRLQPTTEQRKSTLTSLQYFPTPTPPTKPHNSRHPVQILRLAYPPNTTSTVNEITNIPKPPSAKPPMSRHPIQILRLTSPPNTTSTANTTTNIPRQPSSKLQPISRHSTELLRLTSPTNTPSTANEMICVPTPPKDSAPGRVYRRRHRTSVRKSTGADDSSIMQSPQEVLRPKRISASLKSSSTFQTPSLKSHSFRKYN